MRSSRSRSRRRQPADAQPGQREGLRHHAEAQPRAPRARRRRGAARRAGARASGRPRRRRGARRPRRPCSTSPSRVARSMCAPVGLCGKLTTIAPRVGAQLAAARRRGPGPSRARARARRGSLGAGGARDLVQRLVGRRDHDGVVVGAQRRPGRRRRSPPARRRRRARRRPRARRTARRSRRAAAGGRRSRCSRGSARPTARASRRRPGPAARAMRVGLDVGGAQQQLGGELVLGEVALERERADRHRLRRVRRTQPGW